MKGTRVRCVCGTVFNPARDAACPACGTVRSTKVAGPFGSDTRDLPNPGNRNPGDPAIALGDDSGLFGGYKTVVIGVGGVAVVVAAALIVRSMVDPADGADSTRGGDGRSKSHVDSRGSSTPSAARSKAKEQSREVPAGIAAFLGSWRLLDSNMQAEQVIGGVSMAGSNISQTVAAAFKGSGAKATLTVEEHGPYALEIDVTGDGSYTADLAPNQWKPTEQAGGSMTLTPSGLAASDQADDVLLMAVDSDMPHINSKAGDTSLVIQSKGGSPFATVFFGRQGGGGQPHTSVIGTWTNLNAFVDSYLPYRATLDFRDDGSYRIRFTRTERGLLEAGDGKYQFKRAILIGPPVEGRYEFDGPDRFTVIEPRGTATWVRDRN